jgi:RNA polymerase sigma-70 factor (ECF subfamily)
VVAWQRRHVLGAEARQQSDADLVRDSLAGSDEAFGEIVRRYQDLLYRHAERMSGGADEAEDIVQTALIKAYRNLDGCQNPGRVGAWLFRIAANTCKDHLKGRRRNRLSLDDVPSLEADVGDPADALDRKGIQARIALALRRLPLEQREAFVMKHIEGLSYQEMGELLGVSVPALKMRVHRARDGLQELLEDLR